VQAGFSALSFRGQTVAALAAYLVMTGVAWQFLIAPARSSRAERQARLAALSSEAARLRVSTSELRRLERDVTALQQSVAQVLGTPAGRGGMTAILQELYELAGAAGVRLISVTPKPPLTKAQLTESSLEIGLTGSYRDLARFFGELAEMRWLLLASDLHVSVGSAGTLLATCVITAVTFINSGDEPSPVVHTGGAK
jgi:Tfp pilus assembly protein PilO